MISLTLALLVLFASFGAVRAVEAMRLFSLPSVTPDGDQRSAEALFGIVLRTALGLGGIGTLLLLVGAVGFPARWVFVAATVPLAAAGVWLFPWCALAGLRPRGMIEWGLVGVVTAAMVVMLSITLMPQLEIDEMVYHLAVPRAWLNEGRVVAFPTEVTSYFHFLSQMSSLWAMALWPGDVCGPRVLELARTLLAMLGAGALTACLYGRRAGAVVFTAGVLLEEVTRWATTAQIDAGQTLYAVTGTGMMMRWLTVPSDRRALIAGSLCFGFLASTKNTAPFAMAAGLSAAALLRAVDRLWFRRGREEPALREAAALVLPALVVMLPWLVKNLVSTGNPLFPFFSSHFPLRGEATAALRQFHDIYVPDQRPLWLRLIPSLDHIHVVVSNVRPGNVNSLLMWALTGALCLVLSRRFGHERSDLARWFPVMTALPVAFLMLHVPFWRFFTSAWPVAAITGLGGFTLLATTHRRRIAVWVGGALLILFSADGFLSVNQYNQLGQRSLERPPNLPPLTPSQTEEWYRLYDHTAPFLARVEDMLSDDDRLVLGVESYSTPRLRIRFVPNVPCSSDEMWFVMSGWGRPVEEIAGFYAALGATHVLTEKHFDHPIAAEFEARHLQEMARDDRTNIRLYRFQADAGVRP